MNLQLLIPLLITTIVAIVGWVVGHRFTSSRDLRNKRLELRVKYLLEVYRRLERAVGQKVTRSVADDLETAIADLQLLGSEQQVEQAKHYISQFGGKQLSGLSIGDLLSKVRDDLRRELGLKPVGSSIEHLRLTIGSDVATKE
jgi:hypothetical protein